MKKSLVLPIILLMSARSFCQEKKSPIIVNKKVEVTDYQYKYIDYGFQTSLAFSVDYPMIITSSRSERQSYFESGRNIRPEYELGLLQSVKIGPWELSSGIKYQRYSELFSYNEYAIRQVTYQDADGTEHTIEVADGDPVLKSRYNRLDYLIVPLQVKVSPNWFKKKIGIFIEGEYHHLLVADYMGKFAVDESIKPITYDTFNHSYFSLKTGISYSVKLYENWKMTIDPYFSVGTEDMIGVPDFWFGIGATGIQINLSVLY